MPSPVPKWSLSAFCHLSNEIASDWVKQAKKALFKNIAIEVKIISVVKRYWTQPHWKRQDSFLSIGVSYRKVLKEDQGGWLMWLVCLCLSGAYPNQASTLQ